MKAPKKSEESFVAARSNSHLLFAVFISHVTLHTACHLPHLIAENAECTSKLTTGFVDCGGQSGGHKILKIAQHLGTKISGCDAVQYIYYSSRQFYTNYEFNYYTSSG